MKFESEIKVNWAGQAHLRSFGVDGNLTSKHIKISSENPFSIDNCFKWIDFDFEITIEFKFIICTFSFYQNADQTWLMLHESFKMTNGLKPFLGLIKCSWFCMRGGYQKLVKLVWFDQNRPRKSSSYLNMQWLFQPMCLFWVNAILKIDWACVSKLRLIWCSLLVLHGEGASYSLSYMGNFYDRYMIESIDFLSESNLDHFWSLDSFKCNIITSCINSIFWILFWTW